LLFWQEKESIQALLMTATFEKLEDFKKALKPHIDSVEKKAAILLDSSFVSASQKTILREVEMVKWLRPSLKKFFYSISVDFVTKENMTNEFLKEVSD
jgi:hypothetical protein